MRSRKGIDAILRRIFESGGMSEDMEKDIQSLRDEYDEREGELRRYGEFYDGEDEETTEFREREEETVTDEEGSGDNAETEQPTVERGGEDDVIDWKARYNELQTRYLDRFFGGSEEDRSKESALKKESTILSEQDEDVRRDGTTQSFDTLLYRVEGSNESE